MQNATKFHIEISMLGPPLGMKSVPTTLQYLKKGLGKADFIKKYGDTSHENQGETSIHKY